MPTTKPRHAITETESVARALAVARRRWPNQPTSRLLTRLIETGGRVVEDQSAALDAEHEEAVSALTDLARYYPADYLEQVRAGWDA